MERKFFPLSAVTRRINELLQPAITKQYWVKAEISSGRERGGAFYCDLIETDAGGKVVAKLACTIWPRDLASIRELFKSRNMDLVLDDGTNVGFLCSLQYSPQYGISLRVVDADPAIALGEMEIKKRAIIERLQKEGLFEPNKILSVPLLPLRIGLITSAGSAAYNDFVTTLKSSGFGFTVLLADALVQGDQTERSVLKALDALSRLKVELIVIVRGGGSKTDLYYLDNEAIARRIANCGIPVWCGIGHDIDTSVLDYVANKAFKTPTAVAEEIVARFIQMRRQLDESVNTLSTVWTYRLKIDQDYLERVLTGIRQGPRKLLDVTSGALMERAQTLSLRVKGRLAHEKVRVEVSRERLHYQPISLIRTAAEKLSVIRNNLQTRAKFALSGSAAKLSGLKGRFERERFMRRLQVERDRNTRDFAQIKSRLLAELRLKTQQLYNLKGRFRQERVSQLLLAERKSLAGKAATLKAADPQSALQRGFALVYRMDGALVRSIHDIPEHESIRTLLSDGTIVSEVTSKEIRHE
jgi:exodeoxyribonuclease VII large subunit